MNVCIIVHIINNQVKVKELKVHFLTSIFTRGNNYT